MSSVKLYRASNDDFVSVGYSFSDDVAVAEAYTNNPGFGGSNIYVTTVNLTGLLDLHETLDGFEQLSEVLGVQIKPSQHQFHFAQVIQTTPWICEKLESLGFRWVRITDSYPEGAFTYIPVSDEAANEAENNMVEVL